MSLFHSLRCSSRGISTPCSKATSSLGPSGAYSLRSYGSLSSRLSGAQFYRSKYTRIASQRNKSGRIPNKVKRHFSAGVVAQDLRASPKPGSPAPLVPLTETTNDLDVSERVRSAMRNVPHPVSIITSTDPTAPTPKTAFRGMTVSSFNTVTLHPEAIISFNVKVPSETLNAIQASSKFIVHFLAPNKSTAWLSRLFSGGNENLPAEEKERGYLFTSPERPDELPQVKTGEPPLLRLKQDTPAGKEAIDSPFVFQCEYLPQSINVADHMIVLGKVTKVFSHPYVRDGHSAEGSQLCLTYADKRFWKMGADITTGKVDEESA